MTSSEQPGLSGSICDFVKTHCQTCAAGQTITRIATAAHGAGKGTYCLLLREWMTDAEGNGMISGCDRYEPKDNQPLN